MWANIGGQWANFGSRAKIGVIMGYEMILGRKSEMGQFWGGIVFGAIEIVKKFEI